MIIVVNVYNVTKYFNVQIIIIAMYYLDVKKMIFQLKIIIHYMVYYMIHTFNRPYNHLYNNNQYDSKK